VSKPCMCLLRTCPAQLFLLDLITGMIFGDACNVAMHESELYSYLPPPKKKRVLLLHFYLQRACCGPETRYVAVRKERVKKAEKNI
jgi:hypothetical protein